MAWRTPYIIQGVIAALLGLSCKFVPNSPRWLVLHDRRPEAVREIEKLGIHREEAEKDILRMPEDGQGRGSNGFLESLLMPFARAYRRRTILALFVLGMVQLSGIDGVLYVSNKTSSSAADFARNVLPADFDDSTLPRYSSKPGFQSKPLGFWPPA